MIKIISEPRGSIYTALIKYAGKKCTSFSLIWPVDMKIDDSAYQIHQELIEFIESEEEIKSEWQAIDGEDEKNPILRKFVINSKSLDILIKAPKSFACPERENKASWRIDKNREPGLYSWITPALPEDLTFYTADGDMWLMSISHEEESYFNEAIVSPEKVSKELSSLNIEFD